MRGSNWQVFRPDNSNFLFLIVVPCDVLVPLPFVLILFPEFAASFPGKCLFFPEMVAAHVVAAHHHLEKE